jgi:hypothetical protein
MAAKKKQAKSPESSGPKLIGQDPSVLTPAMLAWLQEMAQVNGEEWLAERQGPRWEFLKALGDSQDHRYLEYLCGAIETEPTIPTAALIPLRSALMDLLGSGVLRARLDAFAKQVGLAGKRGRPKTETNFWRACFYWYVRYGGLGSGPIEHAEAIAIVADEFESCDESIVAKAVRAHTGAEEVGKAMALHESNS